MTDQGRDAEQVIRDWLADSAPDRAPASLKQALEGATSLPAGHVRPWSDASGPGRRWAGRAAAVAAILAVAVAGAYFYDSGRATLPGSSSSASTAAFGSPSLTAGASPSAASPTPHKTVTLLLGSKWSLVSGAFPQMVAPDWLQFRSTVFQVNIGSSAGFVAFVPSAGRVTRGSGPGGMVLAAFASAGPTAPTSWETRVYQSSDGVNWIERSSLPSAAATVSSVAASGGSIVAVGWTGELTSETAMAWTTTDLQTWHAVALPAAADYSNAFGVAAGPSGFLAWGYAGTSSKFWISDDGGAWRTLATSGLPTEPPIDNLYGLSDGWAIRGFLSDRAATWKSSIDGAKWTRTWTGPGMSGGESYALGPIFKAPGGGFLSFGGVGVPSGGPAAVPSDMQIWTSSDEMSWTASSRVKSPGWIAGFATGPGGYVAAGVQTTGDSGMVPWGSLAVWTSQDGRGWQSVSGIPPIDSIEVLAVVGDGAHVVVTCADQQGNLLLLVGDGLD